MPLSWKVKVFVEMHLKIMSGIIKVISAKKKLKVLAQLTMVVARETKCLISFCLFV